MEVVVEIVPALSPVIRVPVDTADELVVVRVTPVCEDKHYPVSEHDGDLVLVLQQVPTMLFAEMGIPNRGTRDHGFASDTLLTIFQEVDNLVGAVTNGHLGRESILFLLETQDSADIAELVANPLPLSHPVFAIPVYGANVPRIGVIA